LIVPWECRRKSDKATERYNELWWNHENEYLNDDVKGDLDKIYNAVEKRLTRGSWSPPTFFKDNSPFLELVMDVSLPKLLESHFGPESQPIRVTEAMQAISGQSKASALSLEQQWSTISEDRQMALISECR